MKITFLGAAIITAVVLVALLSLYSLNQKNDGHKHIEDSNF